MCSNVCWTGFSSNAFSIPRANQLHNKRELHTPDQMRHCAAVLGCKQRSRPAAFHAEPSCPDRPGSGCRLPAVPAPMPCWTSYATSVISAKPAPIDIVMPSRYDLTLFRINMRMREGFDHLITPEEWIGKSRGILPGSVHQDVPRIVLQMQPEALKLQCPHASCYEPCSEPYTADAEASVCDFDLTLSWTLSRRHGTMNVSNHAFADCSRDLKRVAAVCS